MFNIMQTTTKRLPKGGPGGQQRVLKMMDFGHFWRFPASPVSENFGAMRTQRHRSFLAPGRPETLKNVQKPSVSIDFGYKNSLTL